MAKAQVKQSEGHLSDDKYVVFPCDTVQWPQVKVELKRLQQDPDGQNLTRRLEELHHLAQTGERARDDNQVAVFPKFGQYLSKIDEMHRQHFYDVTLPSILLRALSIEELCPPEGLELMLQQHAGQMSVSRKFVAAIVACGFLCLFPRLPIERKDCFRSINFTNFFQHLTNPAQQGKLRCFLHYFDRLAQMDTGPQGDITLIRKVVKRSDIRDFDWWQSNESPLCPLAVYHEGCIECAPHPTIHVDFANRKIGGGVLCTGRVQEEIRFCTSPELIISMLVLEAMEENEAIEIKGFETFSAYSGYAKTFQYAGDHRDITPVGEDGNRQSMLCAIDALTRASRRQYHEDLLLRDLNKAFVGFLQCPTGAPKGSGSRTVNEYGEVLSREILVAAMQQAAVVAAHTRHQMSLQDHAHPPSGDRPGFKERSDSSDTSSDSHHSIPPGLSEGDRAWLMGFRRRSSNLSDVGSRRSSDLASRRSSSSTRYSSDLSSDLEELYESFQRQEARQRPAAIKEEMPPSAGPSALQDFVSSMVTGLLDESSSLAAQMMPGVQNFGATQPADVAKPKPFRPSSPDPMAGAACGDFGPVDLDSSSDSSNQTDDQKAKENIVRFVSHLVERAMVGASHSREDDHSRELDLSSHPAWSGSDSSGSPRFPQFLDGSPRPSVPYESCGRLSQPLDSSSRYSHSHDSSPRLSADGSPRMPHPLEGSPRMLHPLDSSPRASHPFDINPRYSNAPDGSPRYGMLGESGPRQLHRDASPRAAGHHADASLSNTDGSPRTEASAWWHHQEALLLNEAARLYNRRRSSTDFAGSTPPSDPVWSAGGGVGEFASHGSRIVDHGSPGAPLSGRRGSWAGQPCGESLTDDFKEAVAHSTSAFHTVQVAAAAAAAAASQVSPTDEDGPQQGSHQQPSLMQELSMDVLGNFVKSRPGTAMGDVRRIRLHLTNDIDVTSCSSRTSSGSRRSYICRGRRRSADTDFKHQHLPSQDATGGASSSAFNIGGADGATVIASQLVQATLESAVRVMRQRSSGSLQGRAHTLQDGASSFSGSHTGSGPGRSISFSMPSKKRKGSMDESLSSFAASLARRSSLEDLNRLRRRGSSGFRDATLSSFAHELIEMNPDVPNLAMFEMRRHSLGERVSMLRRGSAESRTSSLSCNSSTDLLLFANSTPDDNANIGGNPGRRSSREVVLDLLVSSSSSESQPRRKRHHSLTSHLDWFVQDLLMEAFNDSFIEMFGEDCVESVDFQRRQARQRTRMYSETDIELYRFADRFVQDILQQALEVVCHSSTSGHRRERGEEEEEGSSYEDALDFPYPLMEAFATDLAAGIMDTALTKVCRRPQQGLRSIATGNWGCGAFGGNAQLKSMLQWVAASCAGTPTLHYYTFGNPDVQKLPEVAQAIRSQGWNVGHLVQAVAQYAHHRRNGDQLLPSLFETLLEQCVE